MSFTRTLQKLQKAFIMGALVTSAVVAPIKGQSAIPDKPLLTSAMKVKADDTVLAFLPITKDGKFDEAKSKEMAKAFNFEKNMPHIKAYFSSIDKGTPVTDAYKDLITKIIGDNQEMKKLLIEQANVLEEVNKKNEEKNSVSKEYGRLMLALGITMIGGMIVMGVSKKFTDDGYPAMGPTLFALVPMLNLTICGIIGGTVTLCNMAAREADAPYMEKQFVEVHRAFYNAYVEALREREVNKKTPEILVKQAINENIIRTEVQSLERQ